MKVLIVPMAAIAETSGPASRCRLMADTFKTAGIEVATCMSHDLNYRETEGVQNFYLDTPMPFGLPECIATKTFPLMQKLGITAHKSVKSFDQVLWFTGNLDYTYIKKSVSSIRNAIHTYAPDIVYSEFNISALISAKLEKKHLFTTVSAPTQSSYASQPNLGNWLTRFLQEMHLPTTVSVLDLFDWAEQCFCPSIRELEPIEKDNITYCGAWKKVECNTNPKNKILVYMGNGTVSPQKMANEMEKAFIGSKYDVYIASQYLKEVVKQNIHIAKRWDFDMLLNETALFINHGGQNSVIDGLIYGVPQLIIPGKVFERRYNAESIVNYQAGVMISHKDFKAENIRKEAKAVLSSVSFRENAEKLGKVLKLQGGITNIVEKILELN